MNQTSYEFLASHQEWENKTLQDDKQMSKLPLWGTDYNCWTIKAQLLKSLSVLFDDKKHKQDALDVYETKVDGLAFAGIHSTEKNWIRFSTPDPTLLDCLPTGTVLIKVDIELIQPFFSRDDCSYYPTDNVLKRHKIFDNPYYPASSIKGLLRWAYRVSNGTNTFDENGKRLFGLAEDGKSDIDDPQSSIQGLIRCYPLYWEGNLGIQTINPTNREEGKGTGGTLPINYEVVKPGARGTLYFLLPNLPERGLSNKQLEIFLDTLYYLLNFGSLSAKMSAGWGSVTVKNCNAAIKGMSLPEQISEEEKKALEIKKEKERQQQLEEQKKNAKKSSAIQTAEEILRKLDHPVTQADVDRSFNKNLLTSFLGLTEKKLKMKKAEIPAMLEAKRNELLKDSANVTTVSAPAPEEEKKDNLETPKQSTSWLWKNNGMPKFETFKAELLKLAQTC